MASVAEIGAQISDVVSHFESAHSLTSRVDLDLIVMATLFLQVMCLTKAKSSKDQLRQIKAKRLRATEDSDDSDSEAGSGGNYKDQPDEEDDEGRPIREERPAKYAKPTRVELKRSCLAFFNTGLQEEMLRVPRITQRVFDILVPLRPFQRLPFYFHPLPLFL